MPGERGEGGFTRGFKQIRAELFHLFLAKLSLSGESGPYTACLYINISTGSLVLYGTKGGCIF